MTFHAEPLEKKAVYYSIKDGTFRLKSTKDDPEAIAREYTNPKTKESGIAYERAYKALYGTISDIAFHSNTLKDNTVLRSINITLGEDEDGVAQIVSLPEDSRFTSDFLKRLPKIDLKQEIMLFPYDFETDGKRNVGISIAYRNPDTDKFTEKVDNQFFTKVEEVDGKNIYSNLYGFPEATDEDASDWPFYFKKVNKFLIKYAQENICKQFQHEEPTFKQDEGEVDPMAIPF